MADGGAGGGDAGELRCNRSNMMQPAVKESELNQRTILNAEGNFYKGVKTHIDPSDVRHNPSPSIMTPFSGAQSSRGLGNINEGVMNYFGEVDKGIPVAEKVWEIVREKGKESAYFGKSNGSESAEYSKAMEEKLPHKFMGHWDSELNRMVWDPLKAGEDIRLVKDHLSNSYFPRVEGGSLSFTKQGLVNSPPHTDLSATSDS